MGKQHSVARWLEDVTKPDAEWRVFQLRKTVACRLYVWWVRRHLRRACHHRVRT